jgi:hypothetical protein
VLSSYIKQAVLWISKELVPNLKKIYLKNLVTCRNLVLWEIKVKQSRYRPGVALRVPGS